MGLYDRVEFDEGLDVEFPDVGADPFAVTWQTKEIRPRPALETYRVTAAGRLLRENVEYERVPEEQRPGYDEEIGGFGSDFQRWKGMIDATRVGWTDTEYHGTFEFHRTIDDVYVSLEATFTDGRLVDVRRRD